MLLFSVAVAMFLAEIDHRLVRFPKQESMAESVEHTISEPTQPEINANQTPLSHAPNGDSEQQGRQTPEGLALSRSDANDPNSVVLSTLRLQIADLSSQVRRENNVAKHTHVVLTTRHYFSRSPR
jgi:hypothetical protein